MSKIIKAAQLRSLIRDNEANGVFRPIAEETDALEPKDASNVATASAAEVLEKAKQEAAAVRAAAEAETEQLLAQAKAEAETILLKSKEEGWNQGYAEGHREGSEAGQAEVRRQTEELIGLLRSLVREAETIKRQALSHLEKDFLKLAQLAAEKIIRREIAGDPLWLKPVIGDALKKLDSSEQIIVRLSSPDFEAFTEANPAFTGLRGEIDWRQDQQLSPGSFRIETEYGSVDGDLAGRLQKIFQGLEEEVYDEQQ